MRLQIGNELPWPSGHLNSGNATILPPKEAARQTRFAGPISANTEAKILNLPRFLTLAPVGLRFASLLIRLLLIAPPVLSYRSSQRKPVRIAVLRRRSPCQISTPINSLTALLEHTPTRPSTHEFYFGNRVPQRTMSATAPPCVVASLERISPVGARHAVPSFC